MGRIYIEYDNARITTMEDRLLHLELYDGRCFDRLEARRLFPLTGLWQYITLLDSEGEEVAVIRDVENLMEESRQAIHQVLEEYYRIPVILRVTSVDDQFGQLRWGVETDHGPYSLDIRNRHADIKSLYDNRVLVKDANDNRYEIPDLTQLDKASLRRISPYL